MIAPSQFMNLTSTLDPVFPRSCSNSNNRRNSATNLNSSVNRYSSLSSSIIGFNCNTSSVLIVKDLISSMQSPNHSRTSGRYQC
ncbi:hypothetical protein U3516DRAFT_249204 [Neocallimastix sp. 'constans']